MAISQTSVLPQLSTSGACWADPMHQPRQSFCFQSKSKSGDSINQITSKFPSNTVWSRIHMIPRLPPIGRSNTFEHKNNSGMKRSERHNWRLEQTSGRPLADGSMHTLFCNRAIEMSFLRGCGNQDSGGSVTKISWFLKRRKQRFQWPDCYPSDTTALFSSWYHRNAAWSQELAVRSFPVCRLFELRPAGLPPLLSSPHSLCSIPFCSTSLEGKNKVQIVDGCLLATLAFTSMAQLKC